jgi:MscS family membrane protein
MVQIVAFTWLLLRIIDFIAAVLEIRANRTADQADNQLIVFFRDFLKVIIGIIGLMMVLYFAFNYNVSSLLTGLSIVGAAIALALRESLENLIASFVIFFDKPFTTGDFVKVQNVAGTVERIGLRSTRVRTIDKSYVTVPNKQMVDSILDNLSLRTHRRTLISLELHPNTSLEKVTSLLSALSSLMKQNKQINTHTVILADITRDSFLVQVEYFVLNGTQEAFNAIKQEINLAVLQLLDQTGIKLATKETEIILKETRK